MTQGFDNWKYFKHRMLEKLEGFEDRFKIRKRINEHPKLVVLIALISILMLLWAFVPMLLRSVASLPKETHRSVYFYDMNTGELFTAKADVVPPIKAPSGDLPDGSPAGVRAYVFRDPDSPDQETTAYIGWLETRDTALSKDVYLEHRTTPGPDWGKGMLVKRPEDADWTPADTPEGLTIIESARHPDHRGIPPQPVYP